MFIHVATMRQIYKLFVDTQTLLISCNEIDRFKRLKWPYNNKLYKCIIQPLMLSMYQCWSCYFFCRHTTAAQHEHFGGISRNNNLIDDLQNLDSAAGIWIFTEITLNAAGLNANGRFYRISSAGNKYCNELIRVSNFELDKSGRWIQPKTQHLYAEWTYIYIINWNNDKILQSV